MKKLLIVVLSSLAIFACSQNANKKEGVVMSPEANSAPVANQGGSTSPAASAVNPDQVLPEVAAKYDGVVLSVIKKADNSSIDITVPFGVKTQVKDTPISIEVKSYFPEFKMVDGGVGNASMNETNPGSKVVIYKYDKETSNDKEAFSGWLFQAFPGMHGFEDPDYNVILTKSVPKK